MLTYIAILAVSLCLFMLGCWMTTKAYDYDSKLPMFVGLMAATGGVLFVLIGASSTLASVGILLEGVLG